MSPLDAVDPLEEGPSAQDLEMVEYEEEEAAGLELEDGEEEDGSGDYEDYVEMQVEDGGADVSESKRGQPRRRTPAPVSVRRDVTGGMVVIDTLRMMKEKGGAPTTLRKKRTDPLFPKKHPFPFDWGARCELEPGCRAHLVSNWSIRFIFCVGVVGRLRVVLLAFYYENAVVSTEIRGLEAAQF